jgi:hypothetical protein
VSFRIIRAILLPRKLPAVDQKASLPESLTELGKDLEEYLCQNNKVSG